MPSALPLRTDYSSADLRRLAKKSKDNSQSRRLLSLAAVLDDMNRTDAARIGGVDHQTLRDWVQDATALRDHRDGVTGCSVRSEAWLGPDPVVSFNCSVPASFATRSGITKHCPPRLNHPLAEGISRSPAAHRLRRIACQNRFAIVELQAIAQGKDPAQFVVGHLLTGTH